MPRASLDRALRATNDPSGGLSGFGNLDAALSLSRAAPRSRTAAIWLKRVRRSC